MTDNHNHHWKYTKLYKEKMKNIVFSWGWECYDNYGGVSNHKFSYGNNYSQLKRPIIFYAF